MTIGIPMAALPENQGQALSTGCRKGRMDFIKMIQPVTKQANNNDKPWRGRTSTELLTII